MRVITENEEAQVSGGIIGLVATLGFVWYNADKIEDAVNGFFDALSEANE